MAGSRWITALTILLASSLPALAGTISLAWDAVPDSDVQGYKVYYGTSSRNYPSVLDVGNATTATLSGLSDCTTWYAAVKAYDVDGNESEAYSAEISGLPRPTLTSISPATAAQGSTLDLTIGGTNFMSGATVTLAAVGVTVNSVTYVSCNQVKANVTIGATTPTGPKSVDVTNPDQVYGTAASLFSVVTATDPAVTATNPADGGAGGSGSIKPTVTFSQPMLLTTILPGNIRLLLGGRVIAQALGSPSLSADLKTVTITPFTPMQEGNTYKIQVIGGALGVLSVLGRFMPQTYTQVQGFTIQGDVAPPLLSSIAATNVVQSSARITWTTDESSDSQVSYRKAGDSAYFATALDTVLVTSHGINLLGLAPATTYEYHVRSADAAGNVAVSSPDKTFTTAASAYSYLRMEAEAATFTAPMRSTTGTGAFGGSWIDTPAGTPQGTATAPAGTAVYGITIPRTTTWYLWVRMYGANTGSDSFFESIDGAVRAQMVPAVGSWVWVAGRSYTLAAGLHSIELGGREALSRADRVLLTSDPLFIPTEVPAGDTTPPGKVSTFTAVPADDQVTLTWKNPGDADFAKTVIRYRTDGKFPTSPIDGYLVVEKTGTPGSTGTTTHIGLANGTIYSYSAFALDAAGNVSSKATAQGAPRIAFVPPQHAPVVRRVNPRLDGLRETE